MHRDAKIELDYTINFILEVSHQLSRMYAYRLQTDFGLFT